MHFKVVILAVFLFSIGAHALTACGECNVNNQAACFNQTSFYNCVNGVKIETDVMNCKADEVCTTSANICEPKATTTSDIPCTDSCNTCSGLYACVSKTEFARCQNGKPSTSFISACPSDEFCNIEIYGLVQTICAPECVLTYAGLEPSCSNEQVTPPPVPPTTPSHQDLVGACEAPDKKEDTFYVPNPYDTTCRTYIFCENFAPAGATDKDFDAVLLDCKTEFFDSENEKCVANFQCTI